MLANTLLNLSFGGTPNFVHSQKLDNIYEEALVDAIPEFIHGLVDFPKTRPLDESGFSQEFMIALNRCLCSNPKGILAVSEYKDVYTIGANPIKRVDIAFISSILSSSKIKLYTVEAKRLPTGKGNREREYVCGFFANGSPSGGIQRFKTGDHGYGLSKSALLGYIEEYDFLYWKKKINEWISEKAIENSKEWHAEEQLTNINIGNCNQQFSLLKSIAHRESSDNIELFHLWIKVF